MQKKDVSGGVLDKKKKERRVPDVSTAKKKGRGEISSGKRGEKKGSPDLRKRSRSAIGRRAKEGEEELAARKARPTPRFGEKKPARVLAGKGNDSSSRREGRKRTPSEKTGGGGSSRFP